MGCMSLLYKLGRTQWQKVNWWLSIFFDPHTERGQFAKIWTNLIVSIEKNILSFIRMIRKSVNKWIQQFPNYPTLQSSKFVQNRLIVDSFTEGNNRCIWRATWRASPLFTLFPKGAREKAPARVAKVSTAEERNSRRSILVLIVLGLEVGLVNLWFQ